MQSDSTELVFEAMRLRFGLSPRFYNFSYIVNTLSKISGVTRIVRTRGDEGVILSLLKHLQ